MLLADVANDGLEVGKHKLGVVATFGAALGILAACSSVKMTHLHVCIASFTSDQSAHI
jgi:hypothetical protein